MKLNDSQIRAVSHTRGPLLVLAGPGSGKTSVIIQRLNNLIYKQDVSPDKILTVTFSRAAAQELGKRFNETEGTPQVPDGYSGGGEHKNIAGKRYEPAAGATPVFGTFHSVFYNILRYSSPSAAHPAVISAGEKSQFIKTEIERLGIEVLDETEFLSDVYSCISAALTSETGFIDRVPQGMNARGFSEFLSSYMKFKADNSLLDFDDILVECKRLLLSDSDVLRFWQHRFDYIMVDEFQDINQIQYDIVGLLAGEHKNLFVVGDDDQSIYRFRGAKPEIIRNFLTDHPDAGLVKLNINYRSDAEIIKAGSKVISANKNRIDKNIVPAGPEESGPAQDRDSEEAGTVQDRRPENFSGTSAKGPAPGRILYAEGQPYTEKSHAYQPAAAVTVRRFPNRAEECKHILQTLRARQAGGKSLSSAAVLFRNNADANMLINMLEDNMIKYTFSGKVTDVREHFIFKDMISYLRLAQGYPAKIERSDLLRILNRPVRYISKESLARADMYNTDAYTGAGPKRNIESTVSLRRKDMSTYAGAGAGENSVFAGAGRQDYFLMMKRYYAGNRRIQAQISAFESDIRTLKGLAPYAAFRYIWKIIGYEAHIKKYAAERRLDFSTLESKYNEMLELAENFDTVVSFLEYCDKKPDAGSSEAQDEAATDKTRDSDDVVNIMTMHASKGLEFELVILPYVNDSIIPGRNSGSRDELEEERRLLYVAMTRAKNTLMISYVDKARGISAHPYRFSRCLLPAW